MADNETNQETGERTMAEIAVKLEEEDIRKLVEGVELTFRGIVEETLRNKLTTGALRRRLTSRRRCRRLGRRQ